MIPTANDLFNRINHDPFVGPGRVHQVVHQAGGYIERINRALSVLGENRSINLFFAEDGVRLAFYEKHKLATYQQFAICPSGDLTLDFEMAGLPYNGRILRNIQRPTLHIGNAAEVKSYITDQAIATLPPNKVGRFRGMNPAL